MDFYISMAISVLLQALKDRVQKPKIRAAAFKVFREIGYAYEKDATFVNWARDYAAARDQT